MGISKEDQTSSRPEEGPETALGRQAGTEDKGMLPVAASASASAYDPFPGRAHQGTSTRPAESESHVGVDVGVEESRSRGGEDARMQALLSVRAGDAAGN